MSDWKRKYFSEYGNYFSTCFMWKGKGKKMVRKKKKKKITSVSLSLPILKFLLIIISLICFMVLVLTLLVFLLMLLCYVVRKAKISVPVFFLWFLVLIYIWMCRVSPYWIVFDFLKFWLIVSFPCTGFSFLLWFDWMFILGYCHFKPACN